MRQTGIRHANIGSFMLTRNTDIAAFRPAMELGAELGARGVLAQIFDTEESRVIDTPGALCAIARTLELKVAIEFMAFTPGWNTLQSMAALVEKTALPNLAIGNRLAPGDGVFPVACFINALPAGTPLEVEVPQPQTRPPLERVRYAVTAARRMIEAESRLSR